MSIEISLTDWVNYLKIRFVLHQFDQYSEAHGVKEFWKNIFSSISFDITSPNLDDASCITLSTGFVQFRISL